MGKIPAYAMQYCTVSVGIVLSCMVVDPAGCVASGDVAIGVAPLKDVAYIVSPVIAASSTVEPTDLVFAAPVVAKYGCVCDGIWGYRSVMFSLPEDWPITYVDKLGPVPWWIGTRPQRLGVAKVVIPLPP